MNFAFAERCVRQGLWEEMGEHLAGRARALEGAGAELLVCVSNTLHRVADVFTSKLTIPFLHIGDSTGRAVRAAGVERAALLGTKQVMSGDHMKRYLAERYGVEVVVPNEAEQEMIDRVIFDELCRGRFEPESKRRYLEVVDRLAGEGAEGAILGCTEIPLLVGQADRPSIPMFDTARLHVEAALDAAIGSRPGRTEV